MGRNRKYATPEEAHEAKLAQAREKYRLSRVGVERKKWGFINTVITADMIGKTIKELEAEYKAQRPSKAKPTAEHTGSDGTLACGAEQNDSKQEEVKQDIENDAENEGKQEPVE